MFRCGTEIDGEIIEKHGHKFALFSFFVDIEGK